MKLLLSDVRTFIYLCSINLPMIDFKSYSNLEHHPSDLHYYLVNKIVMLFLEILDETFDKIINLSINWI